MAGRIVLQSIDGLKTISQTSHGLVKGNWVRLTSAGNYVKALADTDENAEVVGIIREVIDSDTFKLQTNGYVNDSSIVPNEVHGTVYSLSTLTAGLAEKEPVLNSGDISKPLFIITEPNQEFLIFQYRGVEIGEDSALYIREPLVEVDLTIETNKIITVSQSINIGTENISWNGAVLYEGSTEGYTISGNQITFNIDVDLQIGDKIRIDYYYN